MTLSPIEDAVRDIKAGKLVVVVDDEDRENEGDLILAAEKATAEKIAFMVRHTTGIICVPMLGSRLDELHLPQMVGSNTESLRTAFTVSVDYRHGTTTGVSAADRARTVQALVNPQSAAEDFLRPGHIFPLRYCEGGVLRRTGHTEAAVDLALLAGLAPAGVLAELVNDDGTMQRMPELTQFAAKHQLCLISIADLIAYRREKEQLLRREPERYTVKTPHGEFTAYPYSWLPDKSRPVALVMGDVAGAEGVLVRIHNECIAGDVFGAESCGCRTLLDLAQKKIAAEGRGVLVYLRHPESSEWGFGHQRPKGASNEWRELGAGSQILADLGVRTLRLLTNTSTKFPALAGFGLKVEERVPLVAEESEKR
jgi:3,4-dihydroxy 2-butanone 4-phosphate synthase/GTP cyclohydrolase II